MTKSSDRSDAEDLAQLARGLATPELDGAKAARIAEVARRDVGHGPPRRRWIEALLVGAVIAATLGWAVLKLVELLG